MLEKLCLLLVLLLRTSQSIPNPQISFDKLMNSNFGSNENTDISTKPVGFQSISNPHIDKVIGQVFDININTNIPINIPIEISIDISKGNNSRICDGDEYDCVPYYLCKNNTIDNTGEGILIERFGEPKICTYMEMCCSIEMQSVTPIYQPPVVPQEGCGIRNIKGVGFQITGNKHNEAEYGEFPWMVAVLTKEVGSNETLNLYKCGGSLITSSVVLTAAHCVANEPINSLLVRAGEWDTQNKQELFMDQDRELIHIVIHDKFYRGTLINDIALLFVSMPFDLEPNVQPVCLPPHGTNFDYSHCFATGWGKDNFGKTGKYQEILKKIDLPIIPHDQCETELRTTRLGRYFKLNKSFICAGGEIGKDTCKGDGGSPLVCPIPNTVDRFYQAGIVAWGIGCGDEIPAVYASVSFLRPWIDAVLAEKGIPNTQFTYMT